MLRREHRAAASPRRSRHRVRRPCGKGPQDKAPADVVTGMRRAVEQGHGQEPAFFVACHRPAPKGRGALSQTGATVSRSVIGICKLDARHPPYLHRRSGRQGSYSGSRQTGRSVRHHADTLVGRPPDLPNSGRRVLVYSCANLYVANGCDDRQFSPAARIGGVPSDAPMPCQGDSSNIFGLILGPGLEW